MKKKKFWTDGQNRLNQGNNVSNSNEPQVEIEDNRERDNLPTLEEVRNATTRLKNNKTPGTDHLPAELLKCGTESLEENICHLVQLI